MKGATRITVRGAVPLEQWCELFHWFVGPAARMNLKRLHLGVRFELVPHENAPLTEHSGAIQRMRDAAKRLGLEFEFDSETTLTQPAGAGPP
jgi:hypothetical protein